MFWDKMAANTLCFTSPLSSSLLRNKPQFAASLKRFVSCSSSLPSPVHLSCLGCGAIFSPQPNTLDPSSSSFPGRRRKARVFTALAVVDEEAAVAEGISGEEFVDRANDDVSGEQDPGRLGTPCEVYVCNLPRSCDEKQLLEMFAAFGTVLSAEVCRNAETGESRGCAYVTMRSINSAKNAVVALDGSDVGGREMRVRYSVEMNRGRKNPETMNSSPQKTIYYETPHKIYVGNLSRAVKPGELRNLFSRFGTVVSVRLLHDHKEGKSRVYGFLSFLSEAERDAAMSLNGKELRGRTLVVKEGVERTEL